MKTKLIVHIKLEEVCYYTYIDEKYEKHKNLEWAKAYLVYNGHRDFEVETKVDFTC